MNFFGRLTRTVAAMLMVGLIAGAAVGFSVGVPIKPATTCSQITYGAVCPGNPLNRVRVRIEHSGRMIRVRMRNLTKRRVHVVVRLTFRRGGHGRRVVVRARRLTLVTGRKATVRFAGTGFRRAVLVIRMTDAAGNTRTIAKVVRGNRGDPAMLVFTG